MATVLQFKPRTQVAQKIDGLWPIGTRVSYSDMKNPHEIAVVVGGSKGHGQEVIFIESLGKAHCPASLNDDHLTKGVARRAGWCLEEGIATQAEVDDLTARYSEKDRERKLSREDAAAKLLELRAKGETVLNKLLETRPNAKAVIVAELHEDASEYETDYHASRKVKMLVLALSDHTRDVFSEMRKAAANAPETAYLVNAPKKFEHREKYSMGRGYYLMDSETPHSGWCVRKWELSYRRNEVCEVLGDEDSLRISKRERLDHLKVSSSGSAAAKAWATRRRRKEGHQ